MVSLMPENHPIPLCTFLLLSQLVIEGLDPRSAHSPVEEHKIFWVRILLPFLGRGTELVVDESSTFKVEIG